MSYTNKPETTVISDPNVLSRLYFSEPVQCRFCDEPMDEAEEMPTPVIGIAYQTQIICLCCGSMIDLDDVTYLEYACPKEEDEEIYWLDWHSMLMEAYQNREP